MFGGAITFFTTSHSLKRQFEFEEKLRFKNQDIELLRALYSFKFEIQHNIFALKGIMNIMENEGMDFINFRDSNQNNGLRNIKWLELSGYLIGAQSSELMNKLSAFYYNISLEIYNQVCNKERTIDNSRQALVCLQLLEDEIKQVEPRTDLK